MKNQLSAADRKRIASAARDANRIARQNASKGKLALYPKGKKRMPRRPKPTPQQESRRDLHLSKIAALWDEIGSAEETVRKAQHATAVAIRRAVRDGMTDVEIAHVLGVTKAWIGQIRRDW